MWNTILNITLSYFQNHTFSGLTKANRISKHASIMYGSVWTLWRKPCLTEACHSFHIVVDILWNCIKSTAALWTVTQSRSLSCINPLSCLALCESFTQIASSDPLENTGAQKTGRVEDRYLLITGNLSSSRWQIPVSKILIFSWKCKFYVLQEILSCFSWDLHHLYWRTDSCSALSSKETFYRNYKYQLLTGKWHSVHLRTRPNISGM